MSIDSGCANSFTNSYVQNAPESQASDRSGKKGAYTCQGPSNEDECPGDGERIDSYPVNSLTYIQKSPKGFQQQ